MLTNPSILLRRSMAVYQVLLRQYSRERANHYSGELTRHHEIVVVTAPASGSKQEVGTAFHVSGSPGCWKFVVSAEVHYVNNSYCGRLRFCTIPATQAALNDLEAFLRTVPVKNDDPRFNCQRWAWDAAIYMRDHGYNATPPTTFQGYLSLMHTEAYVKWDTGVESDIE